LLFASTANDGSENANASLALLHSAPKLVPRIQPGHAAGFWPLSRDLEDVAERVVVKATHGGEVGCQRFAVSLLKLLDEVLHVGGDYFFRRLPLWLLLILSFHLYCFGLLAARSGVFVSHHERSETKTTERADRTERRPGPGVVPSGRRGQ